MRLKLILMVLAATAVACSEQSQKPQVADLESKLQALTTTVESLQRKLDDLQLEVDMEGWTKVAYMQPGDGGYSAVNYDLGTLIVKIEDVKPYANGTKLALRLGNLSSARVNGLKATVEWGPVDERGTPRNEKQKKKQITVSQPLPPGGWAIANDVVLEGTPPGELGFVRLRGLGHEGISLRNP